MKKCYKAPVIVVVDLDLEGIICESPTLGGGSNNKDDGDGNGDAASYRSSLWN